MAKLEFYYGVMSASKSTYLLQVDYNYKQLGYNPLIIKPTVDTRDGAYVGVGTIKSRLIDEGTKCLYLNNINRDFLKYIRDNNYNVVLVDEVQFFDSDSIVVLSDVVDYLNVPVLCYGLKTDSNGNLFEGVKKLIAISDTIREIKQICKCGRKATMHLRLVDKKPVIGDSVAIESGNVEYATVCRKCWKRALTESHLMQQYESSCD